MVFYSYCINANQIILDDAIEKYDEEKYSEVIDLLLPVESKSDEVFFYLGYSYFNLDNFDDAINNFVQCKTNYQDCKIGLSHVYYWIDEYDKAIEIMKPIENNEDLKPSVIFRLGYSYDAIDNKEKALELFLKCAQIENSDDAYIGYCQNNVGHMYDNGLGTKIDHAAAFYWYTKAENADIGPYPTTSLAAMYLQGHHVNQSYTKAFELYRKAAEEEFDRANYALGLMYEKGEGTPYDYDKAKEYYLTAFQQGHELALDRIDALEGDQYKALKLAEIYRTGEFDGEDFVGIGIPIEYDESIFWYKVAEFLGDPDNEGFNIAYEKSTDLQYDKAAKNFEMWKKYSGFEYDQETLNDVSEYYLSHRGTGFYINSSYLLTNKHVAHIDDNYYIKCDKITGYDPYSGKFEIYENIQTNYLPKSEDVDLLKATKPIEKNTTYLSSDEVFMGDDVVVIGFPQGKEISKYPKMTTGIVNSEIGSNNNPNEFISDAVTYGGSSGSPVYSASGNLIGILWGGAYQVIKNEDGSVGFSEDPNLSYVIKSSYIKDFLDLNEIEYQVANISEDIKLSKIAKNERGKIRLLECYAHNDQFKLID